jgi:hypothetical protein
MQMKVGFATVLTAAVARRDHGPIHTHRGNAPKTARKGKVPKQGLSRRERRDSKPATSGVTGRIKGHNDWRRWTRNRSIHAALRRKAPDLCRIAQP